MPRNPFRPTFGVTPPLLAGRDSELTSFDDALEIGPGAPGRATLYTGARGVGKTVMLNEVQDRARARGWLVVSETATPGIVRRLVSERLPEAAEAADMVESARKLTGLTLPMQLGGATWSDEVPRRAPDLRRQLDVLTDHLAGRGTGLLLTIDEVHGAAHDELREICATLQHCVREEREIAFAGAGLPSAVSRLLSDDVLTFLRRADRHHLGPVPDADVALALARPLAHEGWVIDAEALVVAVDGTGGYPFLIQLVGYWICQSTDGELITLDSARTGVSAARRRLGSLVHEPALNDLSDVDRSFLVAMSVDGGASRMKDVGERLGVSASFASQYRRRLMDAGMIRAVRHGYVGFTLPYLRDYLREHAASADLGLDDPPTRF